MVFRLLGYPTKMFKLALIVGISAYVGFTPTEARVQECAGCPIDIDPTDSKMRKELIDALASVNAEVEGPITIVRAQTQVVAGVKYIVDFLTRNKKKLCHCSWVDVIWVSPEPQNVEYKCDDL